MKMRKKIFVRSFTTEECEEEDPKGTFIRKSGEK